MDRQSWIFVFGNEPAEAVSQASILKDLLLDASPDIEITGKPGNGYTQAAWTEVIATVVGSTGLAGILTALTRLMKSCHVENLEIMVKNEKEEIIFKGDNVSNKNLQKIIEFMHNKQ